jgi:hypothetical protein
MRPASALATECISEAITLLVSASANFHERSANSVNRSPIEAGNNQMLCPSIGACNRNNFCESFTMRAATQTCFGDGVRSSGHRLRRDGDRMIHHAVTLAAAILAAFGTLASSLTKAQQSPLPVSEISPALFVHTGVMELGRAEMKGPLPMLVSSSEPMRLRLHVCSEWRETYPH